MKTSRWNLTVAAAALACAASSGVARAADVTWVGPPLGNWSDGAHWSGGAVPSNGAPPGATYNVHIDGAAAQASHVVLDLAATVDNLGISAGDQLSVAGPFALGLAGSGGVAALGNAGTLHLHGDAGHVPLYVSAARLSVHGGGAVHLRGEPHVILSGALENLDNTITGEGSLLLVGGATNGPGARVEAGAGGFGRLIVSVAAGRTFVNRGTLGARPGAALELGGRDGAATFDNAGGTVVASDGGVVRLTRNAILRGGTIATAGGGVVRIEANPAQAVTLESFRNTGHLDANNAYFALGGDVVNNGSMAFANSVIRVAGGGSLTLSGGGTLVFDNAGIGTGSVVNTNHTIRGVGGVGGLEGSSFTNAAGGFVDADQPGGHLSVGSYYSSLADLVNRGTLQASNGAQLTVGAHSSRAIDNAGGLIRALDGSTVQLTATRVVGGTLATSGSGVIRASTSTRLEDLVNEGHLLYPSYSIARLHGHLVNAGTISTFGAPQLNYTILFEELTLSGGGTLRMSHSYTNGGRLDNVDNRVCGAGSLHNVALVNHAGGTFDADLPGETLLLAGAAGGLTNRGLMQASHGGTLIVAAVNNAGGTIRADADSTVLIWGDVRAGTVATARGAVVRPRHPANWFMRSHGGNALVLESVGGGSFDNASNAVFGTAGDVSLRGAAIHGGSLLTSTPHAFRVEDGQHATLVDVHSFANIVVHGRAALVARPTLDNAGALDLNGTLIADYKALTPAPDLVGQVRSGYTNGQWNGPGIRSSDSASDPRFGLGYAESGELFASFPATFAGQSVDATSFLVARVRYGDANLDGTVDLADFDRLAGRFGTAAGWSGGDFNYDGTVNLQDFNRLAANFGLSAAGAEVTPQDWAALAAAVPEPGAAGLAGLLGVARALLRRRRHAMR